jgi:hypothetical protein
VPDQLELEHGIFRGHGVDRELLRLDDQRLRLVCHDGHHVVRGLASAGGLTPLGSTLAAVALDLPFELLDELVDRGAHVRRRLPRSEHGAAGPDGRLRHVVRGDRGIAFDRELELDPGVVELALELCELLFGIAADRVADLEVPALHLELHRLSLDAGLGSASDPSGRPART